MSENWVRTTRYNMTQHYRPSPHPHPHPLSSRSHTNTLTPLKLLKLPFPTFRCSACTGLALTLLQHANWATARRRGEKKRATVVIFSCYKSGFSLFLHFSPTQTLNNISSSLTCCSFFKPLYKTISACIFSMVTPSGTWILATLIQNWMLPRELNS